MADSSLAVAEPAAFAEPAVVAEPAEVTEPDSSGVLVEDVLVEEVSIDGMCGVY